MNSLPAPFLYGAAAIAEIAGCFAFFAVFRSGAAKLWLLPGGLALVAFAFLLTLSPARDGRAQPMPCMAASISPPRSPGCSSSKACGLIAGTLSARPSAWPAPPSSCGVRGRRDARHPGRLRHGGNCDIAASPEAPAKEPDPMADSPMDYAEHDRTYNFFIGLTK